MSQVRIDPKQLRHVLGSFVTGVTVIATVDEEGKPHGLTANSFSFVSLEPPLVLWSQSLAAPSHPVFRTARRFAVNILSESQIDVSRRFSSRGADKFATTAHRPGRGGVPLLDGCCAHVECVREASHHGGDHTIYIGRVEDLSRRTKLGQERGWTQGQSLDDDVPLKAMLAEVRAQRLARVIDSHAFADVYGGAIHALSAPVFDRSGKMVLALSVIGATDSLDPGWDARPAGLLRRAAEMPSTRLGHATAPVAHPA